ncbi:hypothetical protein K438DRAFT_796303 [Mycena galopus ATCC 62051]|nr:hypothetical protein K438DRAFT_796303 [Mycena galopus ATCC 62051]
MNSAGVVDPSQSINVSSPVLMGQLNQLLAALKILIILESHSQLTPSLLIGILESLICARLPIPEEHRENLSSSPTSKVACIKIFLGVMQNDILQQDLGIGSVDPRRLAGGADEETLYVARLLCWYGRRIGLISRSDPGAVPQKHTSRNGSGSPSILTTATRLTTTAGSPVRPESATSLSNASSFDEMPPSLTQDVVVGARCIHEVPSPSLVLSPGSNLDDLDAYLFAPQHTSSVRHDGYISLMDEAAEIAAFEARRGRAKGKGKTTANGRRRYAPALSRDTPPSDEDDALPSAAAMDATQARRLELMRRKTELLEKLAQYRVREDERLRAAHQWGGARF